MSRLVPFGFGGADPLLSLHREMNRLFDDVFRTGEPRAFAEGQSGPSGQAAMINARMNVAETDRDVRVSMELPGVRQEDIEVDLSDDVLTISGEKRFEGERGGEKENYHFVERAYGRFQRSIRLPFQANPDDVRASFQDGVLTVSIPKAAQQQRSRRIQVQGGRQEQAAMTDQSQAGETPMPGRTGEGEQPGVAH